MTLPKANFPIKEAFQITYTLPEDASTGTVQLLFVPQNDGEAVDSNSTRVITVGSAGESAGTFTAPNLMTSFSSAAASLSFIQSISPAIDLVHMARYTVTVRYKDTADNIPASFTVGSVEFDTLTEAPNIIAPLHNGYVKSIFTLNISVPETAFSGTVKLEITPDNSASHSTIIDSNGVRELIFSSSIEAAGIHAMAITNISKLTQALSEVESLTNQFDLIDGMVYDLSLQFRDLAFNDAAQTERSRIQFSGAETISPTMASPVGFIPTTIPVDFVIFEDALDGSLQLVIECVSKINEVQDFDVAPRVITFASNVGSHGSHNLLIHNLTTASLDHSYVDSVIPNTDLKDGAIYNFTLKYQDGAGNPVASVTQSRVGYSGNNTLTPSFLLPATDEYIGDPFVISFNLPEQPLAGSVKMTFTPQNDISGVVDNNGARVITFSSSLESAGNHTLSASVFSTF